MKAGAISVDLEVMSGAPCFAGTRVPVQSLFDYLDRAYAGRFFGGFSYGNGGAGASVVG